MQISNKTIVAAVGLTVIGLVAAFVTAEALWAIILLIYLLDEIED
jgi:hypothetical protein